MTASGLGAAPAGWTPGEPPRVPCPTLIGRSAEIETMSSSMAAARAGRGTVVLVGGEAGIGKSRLVQELAARAEADGSRVLHGRAVPGSSGAAFRPLTQALTPVAPEAGADDTLEPWLPALSAILPTLATPIGTDATAPVRGEAIIRLLRSLCTPAGGLLVLEDLHWADLETLAILEHLSDHLVRAPVLCVGTLRTEEPSPARDLLRRLASRRAATVVELARLNDAQVAAMVHSCTGGTDADAVRHVATLADGVPFLVEEMLVAPGLPVSFTDGVRGRLAELSERDRRVLRTAAAFGRQFDWRLLGRAAGVPETDVVDALDRGVEAQLLSVEADGFRFRHALTAEAVIESVTPPRREALANAALRALDAAYPELPAAHLEVAARLAERAGRTHRAGRLHLASADEAVTCGALPTAITTLERSVQLLAGHAGQDTARQRLVDALVRAGRVDDALAVGERLAPRLLPLDAARVRLRLAAAASTAARWSVAEEQLAAAEAALAGRSSPALAAELALRHAELALGVNRTDRAATRAHEALAIARDEDLGEVECEALQLLGRAARRTSLEAAGAWFEQALTAAVAHELPVWQLRARHELGTIALLDRSQVTELLEAQALAERLGAMATVAVLDIEIAAGCAGADDFDGLARHAEQAVARATELGLHLVAAYGWMHLDMAARLRGDLAAADTAAEAARALAPNDRDIDGLLVGAQLFAALLGDDLDAALVLATEMTDRLGASETAPPAHHRAALPVLLARAGRAEAADVLAGLEASSVAVSRGGRAWLMLARAILTGPTDRDAAAELAARADADLVHMPMWRSLARRLAADAAAADGWTIPDGWLAEAEACLRSLGFPAAAAACRRLRGAVPSAVPAAWTARGVTRREADVLVHVAEGATNREIAERLFVSSRTVEKHVESLLRKTGTRTRTELARFATTT